MPCGRRHQSLQDLDCRLSAGVQFLLDFAPIYRITAVVTQPQFNGPPLGLAYTSPVGAENLFIPF